MPTGSGFLQFRSVAKGEASITIGYLSAPSQIFGPRNLRGVMCVDEQSLQTCVKLKRSSGRTIWKVLRPVKLMHTQRGAYMIRIKGATDLHDVFISGCGGITLKGEGQYSLDGTDVVSYWGKRFPIKLLLKP